MRGLSSRRYRGAGAGRTRALCSVLASVSFTCAGACDDASCPPGTTEVDARCIRTQDRDASAETRQPDGSGAVTNAQGVAGGNAAVGLPTPMGGMSTGASSGGAGSGGSAVNPPANAPGSAGAASGSSGSSSDAGVGSAGSDSTTASGPCLGRANENVCDDSVMHHCDSSGVSVAPENCMSAALCQVGVMSGACAQCAPGTFRCTNATLEVCMQNGQFGFQETCASEGLCKADAGQCTDMMCMPNAKTCRSDGTLRTCNADGSAFAPSDMSCGSGLCDQANGRCNECVPSSKHCDGTAVVTCSADGQSVSTMECAPRGECWTASCSGSACQNAAKPANNSSRCNVNGYCDGRGNCVACLADSHCGLNQKCNITSHTCEDVPCPNGVIDPGENCDPQHPFFAQNKGACNGTSCRITNAIYSRCTAAGPCWSGAAWACGSSHQCTTACDASTADFCKTDQGIGACLTIRDTAGNTLQGCLVPCRSSTECPNGLVCTSLPGDTTRFCSGDDLNGADP